MIWFEVLTGSNAPPYTLPISTRKETMRRLAFSLALLLGAAAELRAGVVMTYAEDRFDFGRKMTRCVQTLYVAPGMLRSENECTGEVKNRSPFTASIQKSGVDKILMIDPKSNTYYELIMLSPDARNA